MKEAVRRLPAAALLAALLLIFVPASSDAAVTVTVEYYYAGAVAGGIGFIVYISQSWNLGLAPPGEVPALLSLRGDTLHWGLPLPDLYASPSDGRDEAISPRWSLPVFRWEF